MTLNPIEFNIIWLLYFGCASRTFFCFGLKKILRKIILITLSLQFCKDPHFSTIREIPKLPANLPVFKCMRTPNFIFFLNYNKPHQCHHAFTTHFVPARHKDHLFLLSYLVNLIRIYNKPRNWTKTSLFLTDDLLRIAFVQKLF